LAADAQVYIFKASQFKLLFLAGKITMDEHRDTKRVHNDAAKFRRKRLGDLEDLANRNGLVG
jgi:hypothetical protein